MKVSIIGSGNAATVLGRQIKAAGHNVLQVYSRNIYHAKFLADELQSRATDDWESIVTDADIYLVALSDAAIPEAAIMLGLKKGLVLHTAGSVSIEALKNCSVNYGVLYPLQSLRKEKMDYENIPLLVDGNTADDLCLIEDFAGTISKQVQKADDAYRLKIHVAAVLVNNFTNHLYSLAAEYCEQEQVSFDLLKPLIDETTDRLKDHDPRLLQTGPAVRNDQPTIERHLQMLAAYPALKKVYEVMTESIGS